MFDQCSIAEYHCKRIQEKGVRFLNLDLGIQKGISTFA